MAAMKSPGEPSNLDWFHVQGFKSHRAGSRVDLRALTLLAGANSSGKSSVMQPLLLLKQTLHEDRYDPGPLKLDGPNVVFTDAGQFISQVAVGQRPRFEVSLGVGKDRGRLLYEPSAAGVTLSETGVSVGQAPEIIMRDGSVVSARETAVLLELPGLEAEGKNSIASRHGIAHEIPLVPWVSIAVVDGVLLKGSVEFPAVGWKTHLSNDLMRLIHLGGHRGNPSRRYPRSVSSSDLRPGVFHEQAAGVIAHWKQHDPASLDALQSAMRTVGLGWSIEPVDLDATAIDLRIGRTRETSRAARDLVSIADVGFGVSQSLPVLVALIDAKPGQLVYIEQPEIHLHPRAQVGVADLIVEASRRGARVVIETHSEIILTRIQYHVAKGTLPPKDVLVHWFACDPKTGDTTVTAVEPDAAGAFGDWPVDFAEVGERVDREYIEAAWKRQSGEAG